MDLKISGLTSAYQIDSVKPKANVTQKTVETDKFSSNYKPSSGALEYQFALNAARVSSEVRQERVDELKNQISSSKYSVDLNALADKIVS